MVVYYFPACGFGFWYLLGKYQQLEKNANDIYIGSSGGSLICICSLIDDKYELFETVVGCATETMMQYQRRAYLFNIYLIVSIFIDQMEEFINKDCLDLKLSKLRIQVTEITGFSIRKHQIQPKSWAHLKHLCIASCYIPIISNYKCGLRYSVDGINCVDGFLADLYKPNLFHTFDVSAYRGLIIPSRERVTKMYLTGLNHSNKEEYCWIIHPYYIVLIATCFAFYLIV